MLFRLRFRALSVAAATALAPLGALAAGELGILPRELNLFAREFPQRLLVEEFEGGRAVGQVRDGVTFESSDPSVVRVEDGQAYAVANGRAKLDRGPLLSKSKSKASRSLSDGAFGPTSSPS